MLEEVDMWGCNRSFLTNVAKHFGKWKSITRTKISPKAMSNGEYFTKKN